LSEDGRDRRLFCKWGLIGKNQLAERKMGKVRLFPFSEPVLLFLLFLIFLIFSVKNGFENLVPNTLTGYRIIISFAYIPAYLINCTYCAKQGKIIKSVTYMNRLICLSGKCYQKLQQSVSFGNTS
jgi:hypothetical protein